MQMRSNTILITGGGSGIGRGLAEAFHKLSNQVVIAGRRAELLRQVCSANPGMSHVVLDVTNPESLRSVVGQVTARFPALNCVIANAGVQRVHSFDRDEPVDDRAIEEEIATNLLGVIRVCAAFLPHLRKQPSATLINVSSGLAFVPMASIPVYCATKAAVHSFTVSLRWQLKKSRSRSLSWCPLCGDRPEPRCRKPETGGKRRHSDAAGTVHSTSHAGVEYCLGRGGGWIRKEHPGGELDGSSARSLPDSTTNDRGGITSSSSASALRRCPRGNLLANQRLVDHGLLGIQPEGPDKRTEDQ